MKTSKIWFYFLLIITVFSACAKSEFLDKKPSTGIVQPTTLADFQKLLDNDAVVFNRTGGLANLSSDDYTVTYADWQTSMATQRNAYIWAKDIFAGDVAIQDWNILYKQVFYTNSVLDGLSNNKDANTDQGKYIKGWALFNRAYALYDLTRSFCKAYDAGSSTSNLGIPLRLASAIDYMQQRSTLQESYDQIFKDLTQAENLLPAARPSANLNRPSKIAVYALLARVYLDARNYSMAESCADKCLALYSTLIDFNSVSTSSTAPFSITNDEMIYSSTQVTVYSDFVGNYQGALGKVSMNIINSYEINKDLRLPIYFYKLADGTYNKKSGYNGAGGYGFTGLATDEIYLIKAECLARRNETSTALSVLNQLVIKRYINTSTYIPVTATSASEALSKILLERRKELIWRGLRWYDLKRLNMESANISLSRTLNGVTYTLPPNDPRWVFPIPDDEIALSGIQQNQR